MKLSVVLIVAYLIPCSLLAIENSDLRAPRPDALSYYGSSPEVASPFDTAQLAQIQQCVCQIKNILSSSCGSTPITETGDVVISQSGSYCLINDVSSITITSSFVTLDMGGYVAGSLIISSSGSGTISHIIVQNGFIYNAPQVAGMSATIDFADDVMLSNIQIDSDPSAPARNTGIDISNSGDIIIRDVGILRGLNGIAVHSANSLLVDQTSIINSSGIGIDIGPLPNTDLVIIRNSFIDGSAFSGIQCMGSTLYLNDSRILNSGAGGVVVIGTSLYSYFNNVYVAFCGTGFDLNQNIEMYNCTAINYTNFGFNISGSGVLNSCLAQSTTSAQGGFACSTNFANFTFIDCQSLGNINGFDLSANNVILYNCTSIGSSNAGFNMTGAGLETNTFYNCIANGNSIGFSAQSVVCSLLNCNASSNRSHGFSVTSSPTFAATALVQNCFANNNEGYGFYNLAPGSEVSYAGNAAVGNILGDYNAQKGATPFFWKFAKEQSITLFDNAVIEILLG
jgi:hypothetical protein